MEMGGNGRGAPMTQFESCCGDLLQADAEALVNPVNCVGVMGKGLALQFKRAHAANFRAYAAACANGVVVPGTMFVHDCGEGMLPRFIINFPTKRHWRDRSRLGDVEQGLVALAVEVARLGIRSLAVPPLGCGLGGLDWKVVLPMVIQALGDLPGVTVLLYEPGVGGK